MNILKSLSICDCTLPTFDKTKHNGKVQVMSLDVHIRRSCQDVRSTYNLTDRSRHVTAGYHSRRLFVSKIMFPLDD